MSDTCANGHPWTPANTYRRPDTGSRRCRTCQRAVERAYRARGPVGYDEVAVERAVAGDLNGTHLSAAERMEAVRLLTDAGYSQRQIAERVRTTPRTVQRIRARLRQENP